MYKGHSLAAILGFIRPPITVYTVQTCDLLHAIYYYYFEMVLLLLLLQFLSYVTITFTITTTITITLPSITITITFCLHFQRDNKLHCYHIFSIYIL